MSRLVLVLALLSAPLTAHAACSGHAEQAMTCAEGHVWDQEAGACVPVVTG